ncbi:MAG: response regulator [Anaerolineales bacterium]|nr:response regulator [Anaerolineales bacterium]
MRYVHPFRSRSISRNLAFGLLFALGGVAALVLFVNSVLFSHWARVELDTKIDADLLELTESLSLPIWTYDSDHAQAIGSAYVRDELVAELDIMPHTGPPFFTYKKPGETEMISKTMPITYQGQQIGTVRIALTPHYYTTINRRFFWYYTISLLLMVVILSLISEVVLQHLLARPFNRFIEMVNAYAAGDTQAFTRELPYIGFRSLMAVLKRMGGTIREQFMKLRQLNEELEDRVQERTRSLATANRDLLHAKQAADEARSAAEAANRAKSTFMANMSHELRTPLNAILGYARILKRQAGDTGPVADGAAIIQQCGEHLLTLINDVLDLAKVEAGKLDLHPAPVYLPGFLRQIIGIIQARAEAKGISLSYEALSLLPDGVLVDETRLRQVLLNLLSNAVKFTARGGVSLSVERLAEGCSEAEEAQATLRFTVEDTEVGIPAEQMDLIFKPFKQAGEPGLRAEGTGLGLSISRQTVELMGGQIQVKSAAGQGSTFRFEVTLPVMAITEAERPIPAHNIVGYEGVRRTMLVADDKPYNRRLLVDMLQPLGFEVLTAGDGQEAVDTALQQRPDAMVLDVVMPVKTGIEVIQELRAPGISKDPHHRGLGQRDGERPGEKPGGRSRRLFAQAGQRGRPVACAGSPPGCEMDLHRRSAGGGRTR